MILLAVLLLGGGGVMLWAVNSSSPEPAALRAMDASGQVRVLKDGTLQFLPLGSRKGTGLILYPGGRVQPEAYAPLARRIAERGYPVFIPRMPLNLAVFDIDAAAEIMEAHPEMERWVVGGHSLGGAMAAEFAGNHSSELEGLALWASFPGRSNDLSHSGLEVLSIYGTRDGLAMEEEVKGAANVLPEDTRWVAIEGGNHAGFGWYGPQRGDLAATISKEEQQTQIFRAMIRFLSAVD